MGSRIISIYCHHHLTEYWYDIDNRLKLKRDFSDTQIRGKGIIMRVEKDDPYEHNSDGYVAPYYFKAVLVDPYEDGCFPIKTLRELELVSKHH